MDLLLRRALNDPVFLRYRYRPNCASHTTPTTTQQTTLTPTTAPVTSERPSTAKDELTTLENSTPEADSGGYRQTDVRPDVSGAVRGCVTFNDLVVVSLMTVLIRTITIEWLLSLLTIMTAALSLSFIKLMSAYVALNSRLQYYCYYYRIIIIIFFKLLLLDSTWCICIQ